MWRKPLNTKGPFGLPSIVKNIRLEPLLDVPWHESCLASYLRQLMKKVHETIKNTLITISSFKDICSFRSSVLVRKKTPVSSHAHVHKKKKILPTILLKIITLAIRRMNAYVSLPKIKTEVYYVFIIIMYCTIIWIIISNKKSQKSTSSRWVICNMYVV